MNYRNDVSVKDMWKEVIEAVNERESVMLVTIKEKTGSGPRKAGTRMAVFSDGRQVGTIGGGNVEYQAARLAREGLSKGHQWSRWFDLGNPEAAELGMVCGGKFLLEFRILTREDLPFIEQLAAEEEKKSRVFIFGGGHVAKELVSLLSHLEFSCIVLDDRAEFANKERFEEAEETIVTDFKNLKQVIDVSTQDYVVIMTRGHRQDYEVLRQMIAAEPYYIGVMGSRNKIAYVSEQLKKEGVSRADIERCHMPVGTAIKAQTPAEIAVSIAGQLILCRAEM